MTEPEKGWFLELFLQRIPLQVSPFRIGRNAECELTLATGGVSREHAHLHWLPQQKSWSLQDLDSTNGTFVNGERINQSKALQHGDKVYFGNVEASLSYDPLHQQASGKRAPQVTENLSIQPQAGNSPKSRIERGVFNNIQKGLISTQDLADTLAIDRSTLFRQIKQEFNQSPSDLIREKRLDYAKELLNQSDNISQVAYSTGFESLAHFSRSFKKQFGKSPSDFLKEIHDSLS